MMAHLGSCTKSSLSTSCAMSISRWTSGRAAINSYADALCMHAMVATLPTIVSYTACLCHPVIKLQALTVSAAHFRAVARTRSSKMQLL